MSLVTGAFTADVPLPWLKRATRLVQGFAPLS